MIRWLVIVLCASWVGVASGQSIRYYAGSTYGIEADGGTKGTVGSQSITMSVWHRRASDSFTGAWGSSFGILDAGSYADLMLIAVDASTKYVSGFIKAGGAQTIMGGSAPNSSPSVIGVWQHVVLTRNGTTGKLWVDGVLRQTATVTANAYNATMDRVLLGRIVGIFPFDGDIFGASIWVGVEADQKMVLDLYTLHPREYRNPTWRQDDLWFQNGTTPSIVRDSGSTQTVNAIISAGSGTAPTVSPVPNRPRRRRD